MLDICMYVNVATNYLICRLTPPTALYLVLQFSKHIRSWVESVVVLYCNIIQQKVLIIFLQIYDFYVFNCMVLGISWNLYYFISEGAAVPRFQSGDYLELSEAIEANVRQSNHIDGIAGIQAIMSSITNSTGTCYFSHKLTNFYGTPCLLMCSCTAQNTISHPFVVLFRFSQCQKDECKCGWRQDRYSIFFWWGGKYY